MFMNDFASSREYTGEEWRRRSWRSRALEWFWRRWKSCHYKSKPATLEYKSGLHAFEHGPGMA
jgi:hypothetical protein